MSAPTMTIPEPNPPRAECDRMLGLYMRAWNQLESALFDLFRILHDSDITTSHIIFHAGIGVQTMRDIIQHLGKHRLSPGDQKSLAELLRRAKGATTTRNRLVHGTWQLEITVKRNDAGKASGEKATWIRLYVPADPAVFEEIYTQKNQKVRSKHQFTVRQINNRGQIAYTIAMDIKAFTDSLTLLPVQIPEPLEFDK